MSRPNFASPSALLLVLLAQGCANSGTSVPAAKSSDDAAGLPSGVADDPATTTVDDGPVADSQPDADPASRASVPRRREAPRPAAPYGVSLVDGHSARLPTYYLDGRTYIRGSVGERYSIHISNPTARRVEAVVSVDGRDAVDGGPADYVTRRGYVLPPYGETTIEGFRTSVDEVATFRFSSVKDSYAARLGNARDVGVIGVAFFPEQERVAIPAPAPWKDDGRRAPARSAPPGTPGATAPAPPAPPPAAKAAGRAAESGGDSRSDDSESRRTRGENRPGLGTEFGEARESRVEQTRFVRARQASPDRLVVVRYNDQAGLVALGVIRTPTPSERELVTRETADPFRARRFAPAPPPRD